MPTTLRVDRPDDFEVAQRRKILHRHRHAAGAAGQRVRSIDRTIFCSDALLQLDHLPKT